MQGGHPHTHTAFISLWCQKHHHHHRNIVVLHRLSFIQSSVPSIHLGCRLTATMHTAKELICKWCTNTSAKLFLLSSHSLLLRCSNYNIITLINSHQSSTTSTTSSVRLRILSISNALLWPPPRPSRPASLDAKHPLTRMSRICGLCLVNGVTRPSDP